MVGTETVTTAGDWCAVSSAPSWCRLPRELIGSGAFVLPRHAFGLLLRTSPGRHAPSHTREVAHLFGGRVHCAAERFLITFVSVFCRHNLGVEAPLARDVSGCDMADRMVLVFFRPVKTWASRVQPQRILTGRMRVGTFVP